MAERDRLRIRGLVPPRTLSLSVQAQKILHALHGKTDPLDKAMYLSDLQDRNETLFFRVLIDNLESLAPFVYTPTVGQVCLRFGSYFRRARGMYFSSADRGVMSTMTYNWPQDEVEVVVVTDGSRILGLGDLGANGMGIPIGKLALYVSAGGIDPRKVLPIMLDLGTDNTSLLNDPWYLGATHPRLRGDEYYSLVHEFVHAIHARWPNALIQFEDFSSDKAATILDTYRDKTLCFNDDIQGTGAVTLGALMAAVRTQGPTAKLSDQRIVVCGAGSAGMGVCQSVLDGMVQEGCPPEAARQRFWVLDKDGLIGPGRDGTGLSAPQTLFARTAEDEGETGSDTRLHDKAPLLDVVSAVKPTVLLGFTGVGGAFKEAAIREMARHVARPIIFPLSNPTSNAECTAEQAYRWTEGRAVFGGGSPFDAVTVGGKTIQPSQINNMFIFPGMGLCSVTVRPRRITDAMFYAAAKAMAEMVSESDLALGRVVPRVRDIRRVSARVAAAAATAAIAEGIVQKMPPAGNLTEYMTRQMYNPQYLPVVRGAREAGVGAMPRVEGGARRRRRASPHTLVPPLAGCY
jgi:malate dehydrogenase (oxaloacetate-decarboxylating)(NADP+)